MSTNDSRDPYRDPTLASDDPELERERELARQRDVDRERTVALDRDAVRDEAVRDDGVRPDAVRADAVDRDRYAVVDDATLRETVVQRENERFGGFKFGAAFFGWLTALGALVALTAVVAAIGAATGLASPETVEDAAQAATDNMGAATVIGAIAIAVVLFVAYFAGGYVAGRMARFSGAKQGFAVWIWAIVIAVVVAVITAIAGSQWDILANVDIFPRIPVTAETATMTGILTAIGAAVISLIAAVLGGMSGMAYHRRVDRVGLGDARI